MLTREEQKIVDMIVAAYVTVMGLEKWNSLTGQEQHDAIMMIANVLNKELE